MQVKTKNVAVTALIVLLVLVLWYRVVYSSMGSQASKASAATAELKTQIQTTKAQVGVLQRQSQHNPSDTELITAIPPTPAMSTLFRDLDTIGAMSRVQFQSLAPSSPISANGAESINVTLSVVGPYQNIMSYIDGLMAMPRLLLVDNVSFTAGGAAGNSAASQSASGGGPTGEVFAGQGAPPVLQAQITARVFTSAAATTSGATTSGVSGATPTP